jgi:hypothetical protein
MDINGELILKVWEKASPIPGQDPNVFRIDSSGAWIKLKHFNDTDSIYGWTIHCLNGNDYSMRNVMHLIPVHLHDNNVQLAGLQSAKPTILSDPFL